MQGIRSRSPLRFAVTALTIAGFLAFLQGSVRGALAADAGTPAPSGNSWETWPKKTVEPGVVKPPPPNGAADAGAAAGAKTSSGISTGTIALITLGVGAAIAIGIAAAGGGGGSTTTTNH